MEKRNGSKLIAIIALVVAVAGLSIGFAAFSTTLNIGSSANVQIGDNEWNVGFAAAYDGDMAPLTTASAQTVNGKTSGENNGVAKLMKYTLYQDTPATISATEGSKVEYSFFIKNEGKIAASLASINMGSLTCEYISDAATRSQSDEYNTGTTYTAGSGTITSGDCATMFTVKLSIGDPATVYTSASSVFNNTISAGSYTPIKLTIEATGQTPNTVPNGDFVVSLGNTTVNYGQAS